MKKGGIFGIFRKNQPKKQKLCGKGQKLRIAGKNIMKIGYPSILHIFPSRGARGWTGFKALLKERATKKKAPF